jgi:hypothetical protein
MHVVYYVYLGIPRGNFLSHLFILLTYQLKISLFVKQEILYGRGVELIWV